MNPKKDRQYSNFFNNYDNDKKNDPGTSSLFGSSLIKSTSKYSELDKDTKKDNGTKESKNIVKGDRFFHKL